VCCVGNGQQPESQLSGRVLRADHGLPIEGATISLERAGSIQHNLPLQTATTDSQGRYRFVDSIADGTYFIDVIADGYVSESFSRDGTLDGKFQPITASTRLDVDFRLQRESLIRGVITSANAETGIPVAAVRKEKQKDGSIRLRVQNAAKTDEMGHFSLTKLQADTYFICVNGPNGFSASADAEGWRETWFGGASADDATPIPLKTGEARNDLRINVERELRYRVIVWPSGPEDSPRPDRYGLSIKGRTHSYKTQPDGSYVIPGIPPGHYTLGAIAWAADSQYVGEGETTFDVTNEDVVLHLRVGGLGEIEGVVKSETDVVPSGIMIGIESEHAAQGADVDLSGHFQFGRVLPGGYTFKFLKNPDGLKLRGVRCGSANVSKDEPLRVGDRERITDCELVVGR